jgi:hypothetical protein
VDCAEYAGTYDRYAESRELFFARIVRARQRKLLFTPRFWAVLVPFVRLSDRPRDFSMIGGRLQQGLVSEQGPSLSGCFTKWPAGSTKLVYELLESWRKRCDTLMRCARDAEA